MSGPGYEPVHWHSDHHEDTPYNVTHSPAPDSHQPGFHTPDSTPLEIHDDLPPGAARPRFLGSALARDGPDPRASYTSSNHSFPVIDNNSSVYALNEHRSVGTGGSAFYSLNYRDDPNDPYSSQANLAKPSGPADSPYLAEKRAAYAAPSTRSRRRAFIIGGVVVSLIVIAGAGLGVYFAIGRPKSANGGSGSGSDNSNSASSSGRPSPSGTPGGTLVAVTGSDGSKVTSDDGSTFTYSNKFGGYWYWDTKDPFNNGARAQSWSPALNETFHYGVDVIRGVNLGGWLNTEPFIVPALYEPYLDGTPPAVDEWTLSLNMAADTAKGGLNQLEEHYKTFITERDFAEIAGAGLNWVRLPIGYWAIETRDNEPFLARVSWNYFLKAIQWARKYGIRINLDLHALPGSQNGWNHSGRLGTVGVLNGPMGLANAQRSLDYIRILAEFISQPQYKDVVAMFGVTNEPQGPTFGQENLVRYYLESYKLVRTAGGIGEGNGPFLSFHEGFIGLTDWAGLFAGSDRTSLDIHPYLCFGGQSADPYSARVNTPCDSWANNQNTSMRNFGLTTAGEWSLAINDCGLFVNGVGLGTRYEGTYQGNPPRVGSCTPWTDWATWDQGMKDDIKQFAMSSMDALQQWFFWTWKIGNSSVTGKIESPQWSYQLGLEQGWIPADPRSAAGSCNPGSPFVGPLSAWQTGGAGADNMQATFTNQYTWPPVSISAAGAVETLPTYTPTGTLITLPGPTFTHATGTGTVDVGSGWANSADNAGMYVPVSTCSYLDPWVNPTAAPPSPLCAGSPAKRGFAPPSRITPPPKP